LPIVDDTTLTIVAISAAGVALLALLLGLGAQIRLARVRRDFAALSGDGTTDIARVAATQNHRIDRLTTEVSALQDQVAGAQEDVRQSLRNVAVVRYDAFSDIGGRLSFSAAIVDDFGDGLVLSSIHARGESRTYAKGIVGGKSSVALTPEEQQALTSVATGQSGQSGHQGHSGQSGHQGHSDHSDHSDHQHRSKDAS
jgi:hypothetical protein